MTDVRPWRHLAHRLRSRTEELQEAIQAFRTEGDNIPSRIAKLEAEIARLKQEVATKDEMLVLNKEVDETLEDLDAVVGKQRRVVELDKQKTNERLLTLEKLVTEALGNVVMRPHGWKVSSPGSFFDWLHSQTPHPNRN